MLYVPFYSINQLKGPYETFSEAYSAFLTSNNAPQSLKDNIRRLNEHQREHEEDTNEVNNH